MNVDVLIATSVPEEAQRLWPFIKDKSELTVKRYMTYMVGEIGEKTVGLMVTGVGGYSVAATTALALRDLQPKRAIFTGMAGALQPHLNIGDIVVADKAFGDESISPQREHNYWESPVNGKRLPPFYYVDETMLEKAQAVAKDFAEPVYFGAVTSNDYFPFPPWFAETYRDRNTLTVDFESVPFAQTCWLLEVPFIMVRGITNVSDKETHLEFTEELMEKPTKHSAQFVADLIETL